MRNELVENNWVLDDSTDIEKISDFVYFDGDFYFIENEIDGQKRIYGVYKNKNQAITDEKALKNMIGMGLMPSPLKSILMEKILSHLIISLF